MKKIKFPKELYVFIDDVDEDNSPCLIAVSDINELPDSEEGDEIAIYKLLRVKIFDLMPVLKEKEK